MTEFHGCLYFLQFGLVTLNSQGTTESLRNIYPAPLIDLYIKNETYLNYFNDSFSLDLFMIRHVKKYFD